MRRGSPQRRSGDGGRYGPPQRLSGTRAADGTVQLRRVHHLVGEPLAHRHRGGQQPLLQHLPELRGRDAAGLGHQRLVPARLDVEERVQRLALLAAHARPGQLVGRVLVDAHPGDVPLDAELLHRVPEEDDVRREAVDVEERLGSDPDPVRAGGEQVLLVPAGEEHRRDPLAGAAEEDQLVPQLLRLRQADGEPLDLHHQAGEGPVLPRGPEPAEEPHVGLLLANAEQPQRRSAAGERGGEVDLPHVSAEQLQAPVARCGQPGRDEVVQPVRAAAQRVAQPQVRGVEGDRDLPEPGVVRLAPALGHRGPEDHAPHHLELHHRPDPALVERVEPGELPVRAEGEPVAPGPDAERQLPGARPCLVADVLQRQAQRQPPARAAGEPEVPGVRSGHARGVRGVDVEARPGAEPLAADREGVRRLAVAGADGADVRPAHPVQPHAEPHHSRRRCCRSRGRRRSSRG